VERFEVLEERRQVGVSPIQPVPAPPDTRPILTAVVVNYESWPDVQRLVAVLEREPEFAAGRLHIVVVDNASQGPVPEHFLRPPPPGFRLLRREDNGGFAVGVNAGWQLARSPWLLVLNPDVEIEEGLIGQVIERIEAFAASPAEAPGVVGFALRNPDGSIQGSVGAFPSLFRSIREQFIPRMRRKYQPVWRIRAGSVDWVTGACMLVNCRMMAELGGMDEDFFLYHEEVALCRSALDRGWSIRFDPSVHVIHRHPLQNRAILPKMQVIIRHSKLLYFRKHLPGWQFLGLSWLVSTEAAVRKTAARVAGDAPRSQAWRIIGLLSRRFRAGELVRGPEVLRLAESIQPEEQAGSRTPSEPHLGPDRTDRPENGGRIHAVPPGPAKERQG
jgi:GT2 family glycosyltransferase